MNYNSIVSYMSAGFCLGLGVWVLARDRHPLVHKLFIAGMVALSAEALLAGIGFGAFTSSEVVKYQRIRLIATGVVPGVWLLFTFAYARVNHKEILKKYRWVIASSFFIPPALIILFFGSFFIGEPVRVTSFSWVIRLGWSGYVFYLSLLISFVLILMNLEKTLRESVGHIRWQVKFMVIGLGSLFASRLYTGSQTILYRSLDTELLTINSVVLIVADVLVLKSLFRTRLLNVDFYLSHSLLYNSFTLLIAGVYFLAVGVIAEIIIHFKGVTFHYFEAFLVLLSVIGISILFLSDRLHNRIKRFISVHLKRPFYDYRKEWEEFTQATTSLTDARGLCSAVVKKVSRTFETLSVTIWLVDEREESFLLGGSTVFTDIRARNIRLWNNGAGDFMRMIRSRQDLFDFAYPTDNGVLEFKERNAHYLNEAQMRYCLPLRASGHLLGILALDGRVGNEPLSVADMDLLKTISDQTASMVLNLKLSEHLRQAKEVEAFQTMSAFVMHDLKNLASTLSLTIQNLPVHFDNEAFRKDALQVMQQSVGKVNRMCSQLSTLSRKIELKKTETDVNGVVQASLACLKGTPAVVLHSDLQVLPLLLIDREQIEKVMANLILNAGEAVGSGGEVSVSTEEKNGWVVLSVSDNGCGMSKEFMERSLFRPFKTSKKQGMGIGLFHSKMIVEAHRGRIEVASEEGKGSKFRVYLPITEK
jgi:putative PEP-CTERM system histidine kinase